MPLLLRLLVCSVALTTLNGTCTPLHKAALNGDLNTLKSLIQSGTSINATNEKGMTALHLAAYKGQKDMVKFLLDSGAAFHQKDEYWGMTSLVLAALYEQTEVVEIFLQGGKFTQEGCQAVLSWGGYHGNQKMLAAALTAGASINWQDQFGFTALHLASGEGHKEVIVFLLEQGSGYQHTKFLQAHPAYTGQPLKDTRKWSWC